MKKLLGWRIFKRIGMACFALCFAAGCASDASYCRDSGELEFESAFSDLPEEVLEEESPAMEKSSAMGSNARMMSAVAMTDSAANGGISPTAGQQLVAEVEGRKMIYSVDLTLTVKDIKSGIQSIRELVEENQGYLRNMDDSSMVVRVPVASFQTFYNELEKIGEISRQSISGEDVTDRMMDLENRIKSLELLQQKYREIAQKAEKIDDMLRIERELNRVISELESLKGSMKYLTNQTDYSTVSITLTNEYMDEDIESDMDVAADWLQRYFSENLLDTYWPDSGVNVEDQPYSMRLPDLFLEVSNTVRNVSNFHSLAVMDPDGNVLRISSVENQNGGTLDYYKQLLPKFMKDYLHYENVTSSVETIGEGRLAIFETGEKTGSVRSLYYLLVVFVDQGDFMVRDPGHVYCLEIQTNDKEKFEQYLPVVREALNTVDLSMWR